MKNATKRAMTPNAAAAAIRSSLKDTYKRKIEEWTVRRDSFDRNTTDWRHANGVIAGLRIAINAIPRNTANAAARKGGTGRR